jgi:hypothetical protein
MALTVRLSDDTVLVLGFRSLSHWEVSNTVGMAGVWLFQHRLSGW